MTNNQDKSDMYFANCNLIRYHNKNKCPEGIFPMFFINFTNHGMLIK